MKKLSFSKKDFLIETFRAGGPGGQNQNKRDTGVRIKHIETGIMSESREHRTQKQNKKEAFNKIAKKLLEYYCPKIDPKRFAAGKETVRTYNEPDDRVIDHRTKKRYSYNKTVAKDNIDVIIEDTQKILSKGNR